MSNWPRVMLDEVCDIRIGRTPRRNQQKYWGGENIWLSIADLKADVVNDSSEHITDVAVEEAMPDPIPAGTLLFSFKLTIGRMAFAGVPLYTNEAIAALIVKDKNRLDKRYLKYILSVTAHSTEASHAAKGKTLNKQKLRRIEIPLPPIDVQAKIVSKLDRANQLRKKREEADKKMAAFAPALFHKMFGDPVKNEKGWEVKKFNEIVEINPSKKKILGLKDDTQVSFVPMSDLNASQDTFTAKEVRDLKNVSKGYTYFQDGDVLLAKITPCFENGKSGIAANLKNEIGFGSTEFIVLRPISGVSISDWIYRFVSREIFLKEGTNHMTGTAGQKRISLDWLKEMELPLPPFNLQQKFGSRMERVRDLNRKQLVNHKKLEDVFDGLLSNIL